MCVTYTKILANVRDYVWRFYGNCRTLIRIISLFQLFLYVPIPMAKSQVLKSVNFIKTQKFRYLKDETLFFLQMKKKKNH